MPPNLKNLSCPIHIKSWKLQIHLQEKKKEPEKIHIGWKAEEREIQALRFKGLIPPKLLKLSQNLTLSLLESKRTCFSWLFRQRYSLLRDAKKFVSFHVTVTAIMIITEYYVPVTFSHTLHALTHLIGTGTPGSSYDCPHLIGGNGALENRETYWVKSLSWCVAEPTLWTQSTYKSIIYGVSLVKGQHSTNSEGPQRLNGG